MRIIRSLVFTCFVLMTPILCAIVIIPTFFLTKHLKFMIYQRLVKVYSNVLIMLGFFRVKVLGYGNIPVSGPALFISNHSSLMDSFLLLSAIPRNIHIYAGLVLFRIPFLSYFLRTCGFLPIYFKHPLQSADSLKRAVKMLNEGELMLTFASRITSIEEHIGKIQPGFFEMCERTGVNVIPIAIKGTKDVLTGNKLLIVKPGPVKVIIGVPVDLSSIIKQEGKEKAELTLRRIIHSLYQELG